MRFGVGLKWGAICALVLAAGTATAQGGAAGGSAQVGFQQNPRLTPQEQVSQGELIYSKIEHTSAIIRKQLDTARQARDVVKSQCLSDKLSQVDVAGRSTKDRQTALEAAVQRADAELANHEFTIISVLGQRVTQLMAEANQCIGEEVAFVGQTEVVTTVEPMPGGPDIAGYPPLPPLYVTTPPACTSCTGRSTD